MYVEELIRFTGVEADAAALIPHELVQLYEGTCSERVHEYAIFETLLCETQTTAACAMLEGRPVVHSLTLSQYPRVPSGRQRAVIPQRIIVQRGVGRLGVLRPGATSVQDKSASSFKGGA